MRRQGLPRGKRDGAIQGRGRAEPPVAVGRATAAAEQVELLDVVDLAGRGDGVCRRADGAVVLVPGAAPGDRVEVALEPARAGVRRGRILRVVAASTERTTPPCPVAARCGGCTWLHVSLPRQQQTKAELARRALAPLPWHQSRRAEAGEATAAETPERGGEADLLGWRRRARLHLRRQGDVLAIGLLQAQSDALVAIATCPQLEPALGAWLPRWRRDLEPWVARGEVSATLGSAGLVVQVHGVALAAPGAAQADPAAREDALRALGQGWMRRPVAQGAEIVGVRIELGGPVVTLGAAQVWLEDDEDARRYGLGTFASAAGFSQASARGNAAIRAAVRAALGRLVVRRGGPFARGEELYAGSGNLTPLLAAAALEVRTVEFDADAVARAEAARPRWSEALPSLRGAVLRVGDAGLAELATGDDVVWLLDPGRPGAADVIARATQRPPGALVYVSCAADTLRRDLATLAAAGWSLLAASWVDTMPATPHFEVVVAAVPP